MLVCYYFLNDVLTLYTIKRRSCCREFLQKSRIQDSGNKKEKKKEEVKIRTKCLSQSVLNRIYIHKIHGKTCN